MRKTKAQTEQERQIAEIMDKLHHLLHCGNERVELAAAKELLNLAESEALKEKDNIKLDVNIKVVREE